MTKALLSAAILLTILPTLTAQCDEAFILDHMGVTAADIDRKTSTTSPLTDRYIIPTVLHVFHDGSTARISEAQAMSAIEILNDDFNGLNDAWDDIDPLFDPIKATIDITFCLASVDPLGNATSGIVYYDDRAAMLREKDLYQFAWPNSKYFNIYLPQYVFDPTTNFTAFATLPSSTTISQNRDGVHYSSVRFGYGAESQLEVADDWASVITHEVGHWLGLLHTFQNGCSGSGDGIDDTPPTTGGTIYLSGCDNQDQSCGEPTNGSNFMDYNHRCKRMFTQGQVDVMLGVLNGIRRGMWSDENLVATGCSLPVNTSSSPQRLSSTVYPIPSTGHLTIDPPAHVEIYSTDGQLIKALPTTDAINISEPGVYILGLIRGNNADYEKVIIW